MALLPDHFKWECANVLLGSGDPYSTAGAQAFVSAATDLRISNKLIKVCESKYVSGSGNMKAAIEEIMNTKCCRLNVVFGQAQDLTALFREANTQGYEGEWLVGNEILVHLDDIVNELKRHLDDDAVHKLLRGMYAFISENAEVGA